MRTLKKNWLVVLNMTWRVFANFHETTITTLAFQNLSQGYILSCFYIFHISLSSIGLYLSPQCLLNFLSNYYIPSCVSIQIYRVHIPRMHLFEAFLFMPLLTQKSPPTSCHHALRQKEITHSPRKHSFENLFPPTVKRGGGNYDLLYQNSVRKNEHDLEH